MRVKVVLDTNVFVSSFFGGNPRKIIDPWKTGGIVICLSEEILEEYLRVLGRLRVSAPALAELLNLFKIGENIVFAETPEKVEIVPEDSTDDKFIGCALSAGAEFIVSGDQHLLKLGKFRGVRIVSPARFLEEMEN